MQIHEVIALWISYFVSCWQFAFPAASVSNDCGVEKRSQAWQMCFRIIRHYTSTLQLHIDTRFSGDYTNLFLCPHLRALQNSTLMISHSAGLNLSTSFQARNILYLGATSKMGLFIGGQRSSSNIFLNVTHILFEFTEGCKVHCRAEL